MAEGFEQAGAIPYRVAGKRIEICLITSTRTGRWGIPKGMIDPGDTARDTAVKETVEEAGVRGELVGEAVGSYRYKKFDTELTVEVFLLRAREVAERWLEHRYRQRCWVSCDEALIELADHPALAVVAKGIARLRELEGYQLSSP